MPRFGSTLSIVMTLAVLASCQTTGLPNGGMTDAEEEAMFTIEKQPLETGIKVSGQFGRDWTFGAARERVREICREDGMVYGDDFIAEQVNIREIMAYSATCVPVG